MENRVALIAIVVEDKDSAEELNKILSSYRDYIIGRMGIPYAQRNIGLISIAIDAPSDDINTLTGKIGKLKGVSAKTNYAKMA